jgi:hypothetical protein
VLGIVERSGALIRWAARAAAEERENDERENSERLELIGGDTIPGRVIQISAAGVRLDGDAFGAVDVPEDRVLRVRLREMESQPSEEMMALVLRLPRRQTQDPPKHLVYSVTGDVLRGDLLFLDGQRARIVVRDKTRVIARETIARIDWLDAGEAEPEACRYVLTTRNGATLGLTSAALSGGVMTIEHAVMGRGRVEPSRWKTFHFGDRDAAPESRLQLQAVKQPRTFEDEPRQTDEGR